MKNVQVDEIIVKELKFETGSNDQEYKIKNIWNGVVYVKMFKIGYLSDLNYLVFQNKYPKNKNI